jgi:hypothetical protein
VSVGGSIAAGRQRPDAVDDNDLYIVARGVFPLLVVPAEDPPNIGNMSKA